MAEIVVEDGTNVAGSNCYVTLAFADDYFAAHPFYSVNWDALTDPVKKNYLIYCTSSADNMLPYAGEPTYTDQSLRWPRSGVYDLDGDLISSSVIPLCLKQGICEMAVALSFPGANPDTPSESEGLSELKVDVITLKFTGSTKPAPIPSAAARLFRGLYGPYFNPRVGRVQVRV